MPFIKQKNYLECNAEYLRISDYAKVNFMACYSLCIKMTIAENEAIPDKWSDRMYTVKGGNDSRVIKASIKTLFWSLNTNRVLENLKEPVVIFGAISSGKKCLDETDIVYQMCKELATRKDFHWHSDYLHKEINEPFHVGKKNSYERQQALNSYSCRVDCSKAKTILLVDDFCTTGSTFNTMCRKISNKISEHTIIPVYGITLAKNESFSYNSSRGIDINNSHLDESVERTYNEFYTGYTNE